MYHKELFSNGTICFDVVVTMQAVIVARKSFYLLEALNEKLEIIKSSGMIHSWIYDHKRNSRQDESKDKKELTIWQLVGPFYILLLGCALSLLVFMFELLFQKM